MQTTSTILQGNCLDVLKTLPENSVHMVVTSPPYWGLRAYGTEGQVWPNPDGTVLCDEHEWVSGVKPSNVWGVPNSGSEPGTGSNKRGENVSVVPATTYHTCARCGCWKGELGHEPTPQLYVAHLVQIMREVRRVLRDDGILFLNLGDSYFGSGAQSTNPGGKTEKQTTNVWSYSLGSQRETYDFYGKEPCGLKPKDLVGIPWRVAFALQDDGWWLRQDIIWAKPNPIPESVTDRCTKAHEYMFLLAKSARYYYDAEAVKEPVSADMALRASRGYTRGGNGKVDESRNDSETLRGEQSKAIDASGRNRRSVWTITTKPFRDAHFATFPPDLVEPCIKAGTSQHGVCSVCGSPWERVVDHHNAVLELSETAKAKRDQGLATQTGGKQVTPVTSVTVGWKPSCDCNADVVPATVLDPFNGAGTTGVVAKSLLRSYIGIELNPKYVEMAERRIRKTQEPLFIV